MRTPLAFLVLLLFVSQLSLSSATDEGSDEGDRSNNVCEKDGGCAEQEDASPKKKKSSKEMYAELKENLKSIKESCGEVCDTEKTGVPGEYINSKENHWRWPALAS